MAVLEITRSGATAVLTMNRPAARNALDMELRAAFADAVATVREDAAVRSVVLTGAGGHFCAGGDVRAIASGGQGKRDIFEGRTRIQEIQRWMDELIDLEKPVIAAVDGVAFGAGMSLALAADFVLVSPRASFCSAFTRVGFVPDMGAMYLLPRAVGLSRAKEIVFTGRVIDAQEACALGMAHQLCADGDVLSAAIRLAAGFEHAPAGAIAIMKSVMNHAFESERRIVFAQESMAQAMCRESDFHQEAVRRFLDKETPLYHWPAAPATSAK